MDVSVDYQLITVLPITLSCYYTLGKKATIHQETTVLATSKNVLFLGHNHLLNTGADDSSLLAGARVIIKVLLSRQHRWLAGGCDLKIGHF